MSLGVSARCSCADRCSRRTRLLIVNVSPDGPVRTIRDALSQVARGGTIVVHAGTLSRQHDRGRDPVRIIGDGDAVLDGEGKRQIMTITSDSVTVRGLRFVNVGVAFTEDLRGDQGRARVRAA